jgi:hypothetical protein
MTLSINCKNAGDPVCTHTMYGDTEDELIANAKKHGMKKCPEIWTILRNL